MAFGYSSLTNSDTSTRSKLCSTKSRQNARALLKPYGLARVQAGVREVLIRTTNKRRVQSQSLGCESASRNNAYRQQRTTELQKLAKMDKEDRWQSVVKNSKYGIGT